MPTPRENVTAYALSRLFDAADVVERARCMLWVADSLTAMELKSLDRARADLHAVVGAKMERVFPLASNGEDLAMPIAKDNI